MNKTILIVDDDEMLQTIVSFLLEEEGYNVLTAKNGEMAIDLLKNEVIDLILSDLMMPVINGMELVEKIRNQLNLQTPIIMFSSAGQEKNVLEAFNLGADEFIPKPISNKELLIRINKLLS